MVTKRDAIVLEVKECSRRRAATRLVVAEIEWWTVVRGPAANGKIEFRSCDVVPVEEDALHPDLIAVGHPCRRAIDIETIRLAVEDLHAGGIAEHFVHAQPRTKADVVRDLCIKLQTQTVREQGIGIGIVGRAVYARNLLQVLDQHLLHLR